MFHYYFVLARAPIGSVRFQFKPNRYQTDWIGIGIGIYRNFGFGFYRLPIPISKIPKPKPKYRNLISVLLKNCVSQFISASRGRRRMRRSSLEPPRRAASNGGGFILLRPLDAEIFNETSTNRHLTFSLLRHLPFR